MGEEMNDDTVSWEMINNLVPEESQYKDAKDAPLDEVRMAWPFKTEAELKRLSKWFKKDRERLIKQKKESVGEALL